MGIFSGIKEARNKNKDIKRDHLNKLAVEAVSNGTYRFFYGYNSAEGLQEIKEVIEEMNKELAQDNMTLAVTATYSGYTKVTCKKDILGYFDYGVEICIDAK